MMAYQTGYKPTTCGGGLQPESFGPQPTTNYGLEEYDKTHRQQLYNPKPVQIVHTTDRALRARPPSFLGFAICVTLCCNPVLGLTAVILSVSSRFEADAGNYAGAESRGRVSRTLSATGIVVSFLGVLIFAILYFTVLGGHFIPH